MESPGEIGSTDTHVVIGTLPAGANATTDVAEKTIGVITVPAEGGSTGVFALAGVFSPDGAVQGTGTAYHSLQVTAYDSTGTQIGGGPIAQVDLKANSAQLAALRIPVVAAGDVKLGDLTTIRAKTVHTGTPAAAFPGGTVSVSFTHLEEDM